MSSQDTTYFPNGPPKNQFIGISSQPTAPSLFHVDNQKDESKGWIWFQVPLWFAPDESCQLVLLKDEKNDIASQTSSKLFALARLSGTVIQNFCIPGHEIERIFPRVPNYSFTSSFTFKYSPIDLLLPGRFYRLLIRVSTSICLSLLDYSILIIVGMSQGQETSNSWPF